MSTENEFKKEGDFINHSSHLTQQQLNIKHCQLPFVAVKAYAGSGKTTVLYEYAISNADKQGLYLAFNKNIAEEAQKKFPNTVKCSTVHSLAYGKVGFPFREKLSGSDYKIGQIAKELQINDYQLAEYVLNLLKKFIASNYTTIDEMFITIRAKEIKAINELLDKKYSKKDYLQKADVICLAVKNALREILIKKTQNVPEVVVLTMDKLQHNMALFLAKKIWDCIVNIDHSFPMTHDTYLKLFQMTNPTFINPKTKTIYDFILYDEAQDSNDCTIDLLLKQDTTKIFVGDPYQQIYQFRGAVNAFDKIKDKTNAILPLSKSWRFGHNIANLATIILQAFYQETTQLEGINSETTIQSKKEFRNKDSNTLNLYRTNAQIVADCIYEITANPNAKFYFIGNSESYLINQILDYYYLKSNQIDRITDKQVLKYPDWNTYMTEAGVNKDPVAQTTIKVVEEFDKQLEVYIPRIHQRITKNVHQASMLISTAHKAKGREFDRVVLGDDFLDLNMFRNIKTFQVIQKDSLLKANLLAEINLLYVAITRAKKELYIPQEILVYLKAVLAYNKTLDNKYIFIHDDESIQYAHKNNISLLDTPNPFVPKLSKDLILFLEKILK